MTKKYRNFMYENQLKYMEERQIPIDINMLAKYVEEVLNPAEYVIILHDKDKSTINESELVAPHYHIALKFENPRNVNNVAKKFNDLPQNFEIWLNRPNNLYSYLIHKTSDAHSKFQYDVTNVVANFDFTERINKITKSIHRGRNEEIRHLIDSFGNGEITLKLLMEELSPTEYARNENQINIIKKLLANKRFEAFKKRMDSEEKRIEVFYLFGGTGTGKTRFAKTRYKENRYITGSNRDLFANYDGETVVILDELRPNSISYNELLKITDPFNFENVVGSRYLDKKLVAETIVITTPFSPEEFYQTLKGEQTYNENHDLFSNIEMKILLSDEQLEAISTQLNNLIFTEIEKIRTQENLQHRYMNKKQTCNYLQISNNTLDSWIREGLPCIKINGSNRFDRMAVDKWLTNVAK